MFSICIILERSAHQPLPKESACAAHTFAVRVEQSWYWPLYPLSWECLEGPTTILFHRLLRQFDTASLTCHSDLYSCSISPCSASAISTIGVLDRSHGNTMTLAMLSVAARLRRGRRLERRMPHRFKLFLQPSEDSTPLPTSIHTGRYHCRQFHLYHCLLCLRALQTHR
ncbi:hypothetical protein BDY19DRAFT_759141 [Irpex rosettiformis]|uniref:Uncharacterized protein n=1 Tax=Irpex rosettiformis TaxID=378272 RepID=A0ACB8U7G6_9APHY|nr:hypothetical protein BDY19DRAFT_759141 [Irpex rosettiformis]